VIAVDSERRRASEQREPRGAGMVVSRAERDRRGSLCGELVAVVEPAESGACHNGGWLTSRLHGLPAGWRLFVESEVRPVVVGVGHVVAKQTSEMTLAEDDDPVE
jgi:hypothetical protein